MHQALLDPRPSLRAAALVLLPLLSLAGCRCQGPDAPTLTVLPDGSLQLEQGRDPLVDGERLWIFSPQGEQPALEQRLGEIAVVGPRQPEERFSAELRCAPRGGLAPGSYALGRAAPGVWPCERWGEVLEPAVPMLQLPPQLRLPAGTLLRIVRTRPEGGELVLWGRLGAPGDAPGVHAFELLLPLDPPALVTGEAVDLSDPDGNGLGEKMREVALGSAEQTLQTARESYLLAGGTVQQHEATAALFVLADRSAERLARVVLAAPVPDQAPPALAAAAAETGAPTEGLAAAGTAVAADAALAAGEAAFPPEADLAWDSWVQLVENGLDEAGPVASREREIAVRVAMAHLPYLERRVQEQPGRRADVDRLRALSEASLPRELGPGRRPPPPSAPPKKKLEYLELSQMPEEIKEQYRYIRAIPVNPDPARFADRSTEELRREQVAPLLEHASGFLEKAGELAQRSQQAPDPQVTCRVLFALDNVERGQRVYRSSAEDLQQARSLSFRITDRLLQEGRRECLRMMHNNPNAQ